MAVSFASHEQKHTFMLLDVARYLSCVSVFVAHFMFIFVVRLYGLNRTYYDKNMYISAFYYSAHALAVMVFFVLSGFLIGRQALQEIKLNDHFAMRDYLTKRILRIIPPLYFAILFTLMLYALIKALHLFGSQSYHLANDLYVITAKAQLTASMLLKCALLVPGDTSLSMNGALWSLSYEFYYYLFFAWVLAWVANKNLVELAYLSIYVIALPLFFMLHDPNYVAKFFEVLILGLVWLAGVGIAHLQLEQKQILSQKAIIYLGLLVLIFVYPLATHMGDVIVELSGGLFAALLIMYLVNFKFTHVPPKFLNYLARGSFYTYTLYLLNFPLMLFTFSILGREILKFRWPQYLALFIALFILANYACYYLAQSLENRKFWGMLLNKMLFKDRERL